MKIRFIMLGRTRRLEIRDLLADYLRRIERYAEIEVIEWRDARQSALRKLKIAPHAPAVFLDASGKEFTSAEFANWLGRLRDRGAREVSFFCGAAEGFPSALQRDACLKLSLSRLTMPHEMARLVLAEQIYRAFTMLTGHPYPK